MKKIVLIAFTLLFTTITSQAYEMAFTGGIQTTDVENNNIKLDGTGFFSGILGFIEMNESSYFRTGALLSQRKYEGSDAFGTLKAETMSIDVPLTYMHLFNENVGIFGGLKLGLNLDDDCDFSGISCDLKAETLHYAATVGGHFRFIPNFGIEVEYAIGLSDIAKDTEWDNSLAVGAFFLF